MKKIIVAAVAQNRVIGKAGELAWSLPADQAFFSSQVQEGWLLTGRTSFESAHGTSTFQDQERVIILTSNKNYQAGKAHIAHTLQEAYHVAEQYPAERLVILGGAVVYAEALADADEMILTEIHAAPGGDTFFPEVDFSQWIETRREDHHKDAQNPYDYSFVWYTRKQVPPR